MRQFPLLLCMSAMLAACGSVTPIASLQLPPERTIEGTITRITADGFMLKDHSGRIHVEMEKNKPANLETGEHVRVIGNIDEDDQSEFDAYRVIRANGVTINAI